jgi:Family of unknown function (DUF6011)
MYMESTTATDRQIDLMAKLTYEIMPEGERMQAVADIRAWGVTAGKRSASYKIDELMATAKLARQTVYDAKPKAEAGYYVRGSEFYVVVISKRSGNPYAKRLDVHECSDGSFRASWEYAPGTAAVLAESTPLTIEQAIEFGHQHGICIICTTTLDDPESVAWGIGPTCYKNITGKRRPKYLSCHEAPDAHATAKPSQPALV